MDKSSFFEVVKLSPNVLIQEIDGESVLLNMASEKYFGLDEVGTLFVNCLGESGRVNDAMRVLLDEFNVEETVLRNDIASLVAAMHEQGLVEVGDG
jgi:hypothetical protein